MGETGSGTRRHEATLSLMDLLRELEEVGAENTTVRRGYERDTALRREKLELVAWARAADLQYEIDRRASELDAARAEREELQNAIWGWLRITGAALGLVLSAQALNAMRLFI